MLQTGFILNRRDDLIWFLGFPFAAIAFALSCQLWLPAVALASVSLWITVPHHFATWLRTYGIREDWARWKDQLIIGPLVIITMAVLGLAYAPLTLAIVAVLWDHQHSVMQQHGLARIYDFKAKTGAPSTRNFDMALNWVLYVNLFLTAPLFAQVWLRWLYRWDFRIPYSAIVLLQHVSLIVVGLYLCVYVGHVLWCLRRGYTLNPVKYAFIAASFFLWYFTAWHTDSILVAGVAHRLMHGVQYIVMVYWYTRRKVHGTAPTGDRKRLVHRLVQAGNVKLFLLGCLVYAVVYQLLIGAPLGEFGFGIFNFTEGTAAIPELGLNGFGIEARYDLYANSIITTTGFAHYYFDSFIWKVRDRSVQSGL